MKISKISKISKIFYLFWTRGYLDLKPTHKVGFFFSAIVDGLTNYVIMHPILIKKYDIITVPPFP